MPDRFYPIVPDAAWVERIVPLGVKSVQLRVKNRPEQEVAKEIAAALTICRTYGCELVVNDYWRLAIELGAETVHLGQEDLAEADLPAIRRAGVKLGVSTHTDQELKIALAAEPHHVALGPVYETTLKVMKYAPQGLDRIGLWKGRISCPLVAIGGITLERAPAVFAAGADSIAVVTDIVSHPEPETRVRDWLRLTGSRNPDRGDQRIGR
jgi:thiamine-phosphate pyrophosphorylase